MKIIMIMVLILVASCSSKKVVYQCKSSREYITTLKYLRAHKEFAIRDSQARKISDEVSNHCTGASSRFVRVTNLLSQAGLGTSSAILIGKRFANSDESKTLAFIEIFRESFLKKFLDLPLANAMEIALKLSVDFEGTGKRARRDFHRLVRFCVSADHLDLPKPKCAKIAAEVTAHGKGFKNDIASPFVRLFEFLTSSSRGPKQPLYDALELSRTIMKNGPQSAENFIIGYRYATSKKGLGVGRVEAVKFGKKMALRTLKAKSE